MMLLGIFAIALAALSIWTSYLWNRMLSERGEMDIPSYISAKLLKLILPPTYPTIDPYSPKLWRKRLGKMRKSAKYIFNGTVTDLDIPAADEKTALKAKLYHPAKYTDSARPLPIILWIHGGGWVIGDVEVDHLMAAKLSDYSHMIVISISYRMAPEDPFPAAADDVLRALVWVKESIASYGGNGDEIYVAGESSGANLAASLTSTSLDENIMGEQQISIRGSALVYPPMASFSDLPSYEEYDSLSLLSAAQMERFRVVYIGNNDSARYDYRYAPLLTPDRILVKYPPTILVIAKYDVLADDSLYFEKKLQSLHLPVVSRLYNTSTHGFFASDGLPFAEEAVQFVCEELKKISLSISRQK